MNKHTFPVIVNKIKRHNYYFHIRNRALVPLRNLELHVSHACNLACENCSHYSNHNLKGSVTAATAAEWMALWNKRVIPKQFSLLGGEPTINPQLPEIILLTRKMWKLSKIMLITNGFFLHRHPDLPKVLKEAGNVILAISVHHNSKEYLDKIQPNLELADEWRRRYHLDIEIRPSAKYWTRRYKGYGSQMQPFEDNNPIESWKQCFSKYCTQLYDGKLWKCPPLAYLHLQDEKYKLSDKWDKYLKYKALLPGCTDAELIAFSKEKEIAECAMCAAKMEQFELQNPLIRPKDKLIANEI